MKTRYKLLIISIMVILIILFTLMSYNYEIMIVGKGAFEDLRPDDRGVVYPGTGSFMLGHASQLCESLLGNATIGNCFGINDICEDIDGIFRYNEQRSEVGCSLHKRVDHNCTDSQLANGWIEVSENYICYLPFEKELMDSRK